VLPLVEAVVVDFVVVIFVVDFADIDLPLVLDLPLVVDVNVGLPFVFVVVLVVVGAPCCVVVRVDCARDAPPCCDGPCEPATADANGSITIANVAIETFTNRIRVLQGGVWGKPCATE
jgi:hypothetical protein